MHRARPPPPTAGDATQFGKVGGTDSIDIMVNAIKLYTGHGYYTEPAIQMFRRIVQAACVNTCHGKRTSRILHVPLMHSIPVCVGSRECGRRIRALRALSGARAQRARGSIDGGAGGGGERGEVRRAGGGEESARR